jgi:hypothetical protein
MTSERIRDPYADHLLTPHNCALVIIDYQPVQVRSIRSMDQDVLVDRVVHLARFGMLYRLPVVLSDGQRLLRPEPAHHRSTPGRTAGDRGPGPDDDQRLGRHRVQAGGPGGRPPQADHGRAVDRGLFDLPLAGCDERGYETYPVTDAVGGTSPEAHQAGLDRIAQAGGQPASVVQVGCELQRDWARRETAGGFTQILFGGERPLAGGGSEPAGNGTRAGR